MRTFYTIIAALLLVTPIAAFLPARPALAQPDLDDPANWISQLLNAKSGAEETAQTGIQSKQLVKETVLDKLAIVAARIASEKLTNATLQWVQGGFKGGKQLYIGSFQSFLAETGDAALRAGLNQLTQNSIDVEYNPAEQGENVLPGANLLPNWIQDYIMERMKLKDTDALDKLVENAGIKELTNYCNGTGWDGGCLSSPDIPIVGNCGTLSANQCKMQATEWEINVALRNGTLVTFQTSGWAADEALAVPVRDSRQTLTIPGPGGTPIQSVVGISSNIGSFADGQLNAFGTALTQTAVRAYHSTISGTIETTLKEELGPQWLDFANDITVGYDRFNPYGSWELLLAAGNNPVGTVYETANRIALSADKKLNAALTEAQSSGFLPDKTCTQLGAIIFADGTEEEICEEFSTNNPASLVGQSVGAAVTKSFDLATDADEWEKLGVQVLADMTTAVVTGGLQAVAGEIKNKSAEVTAQIRQLGPISYLFGEVTDGATLGDDQSWQLLSSRDIDFATLNEKIALTAREANYAALTGDILQGLAIPTLVLDQECVFGPDFGWESRLRTNFQEDVDRLRQEVTKNASENNDNNKEKARAQLFNTLNEELESQAEWVKEAMPTNPFTYQQQFMSLVDSSLDDIAEGKEFEQIATDKQAAATTLIRVRDTLLTIPGAEILLQSPPSWQDDPEEVFSGISDLGAISESSGAFNEDAQLVSRQDILESAQQEGASTQAGVPRIVVTKANVTLPHQEEAYSFDVLTGVDAWDKEDDVSDGSATYDKLVANANNNILIERVETGANGQLVYVPLSGTTIDLSDQEIIPEQLDGDGNVIVPETTQGISYRVTYSVTDSNGNQATARRFINVKTFDEYLTDLSDYNRELSTFLQGLADETRQTRTRISQAVNLYLGVEKDFSTESSVQEALGAYETAQEKVANINSSLELCWLELYRLDVNVDPENFASIADYPYEGKSPSAPSITPPFGFGAYTSQWNQFQETLALKLPQGADPRVPYITRSIPFSVSRNPAQSPLGQAVLGGLQGGAQNFDDWLEQNPWAKYLSPATAIYSAFRPDTPTGAQGIVRYILQPDEVSAVVPDFKCSLDTELRSRINEICTSNACRNAIYESYENYHCISRAKNYPIDDGDTEQDRRNRSGERIANAYNLGRWPIGSFEGVMELTDDNPNDPGFQINVGTCQNNNTQGGGNGYFKEEVYGSPIKDCRHWYGSLIHRIPNLDPAFFVNGVGYGSASIHPYAEAWGENNSIWPAQYNGWWPDENANPRYWTSGVMHTIDVYGDHTKGILYCRYNSILFNPLYSFNTFKFGVSPGDSWWIGEFNSGGQPITEGIGNRFWENIQRCDDWTQSDLATYANYPDTDL